MEIGVYSFAELRGDAASAEQRLHNLIEEIELAEAVGLDVFGTKVAPAVRAQIG